MEQAEEPAAEPEPEPEVVSGFFAALLDGFVFLFFGDLQNGVLKDFVVSARILFLPG